jgi:hypothetical protein
MIVFGTGLLALTAVSVVACTVEVQESTGYAEQEAITPPLPGNLNLILNAKASVTIAPFTQINGDIGSSGVTGSALLDVSALQGSGGRLLANTMARVGAIPARRS